MYLFSNPDQGFQQSYSPKLFGFAGILWIQLAQVALYLHLKILGKF